MSFKLVAIRPLEGCSRKYLKVLKEDKAYVFYNEYDFIDYSDDNRKVIINQDMALNLYSTDGVDINISAIVGKNGSGKSSVVELLYVSLYNISAIKEVLYRENLKRKLNSKDIERDIKVELFYKEGDELLMLQLINDNIVLFKYVDGCFSEVKSKDFDFKDFFYSIAINYSHYALNSREIGDWVNNVFHKNDSYQTPLVINPMRTDGNIDINRENDLVRSRLISNILSDNEKLRVLAKGKTVKYLKFFLIDEKLQKKSRCDYDRYGEIVPFLYKYFFKDEKFEPAETQLNMYTKRYIIGKVFDICHKYKQYKYFSRFFGDSKNSSKIEEFAICLFKDNSHITFKLRQSIYFLKYGGCVDKDDFRILDVSPKPLTRSYRDRYSIILEKLYKYILKDETFSPAFSEINVKIKSYTIDKVYEICHSLKKYKKYITYFNKQMNIEKIDEFAYKIYEGSDEVFEEIKKAISFLKYGGTNTLKNVVHLSDEINSILKKEKDKFKLIEIIPPSFIDIEIYFDDDANTFERLSSGEKQKIYAISSLVYHLVNLDSVNEDINPDEKLIKYNYINFIFDEIELYYHPELQRTFIKDLLDRISVVKFKHILGINCIFITHSPFILSDIPRANILILNGEDISTDAKVDNTFGANIHDLLKNSFFLQNGAMGEFAREKINETIAFIQHSKESVNNSTHKNGKTTEKLDLEKKEANRLSLVNSSKIDSHKKRIDLIGEPILKRKLLQMYNEVFGISDELLEVQTEIARLQEREKKLLIKSK